MKKTSLIHLGAVLFVLFFATSCTSTYKGFDDCHNTIMLKNSTQSTIYYMSTLKDGFMNYDPTNPTYAADYKIQAGESRKVKIGISLSCWEQVMKSADGYVYIYIYDAAYLEANPWVDAKNHYLKKYTLNASQLNKTNWTITYQ